MNTDNSQSNLPLVRHQRRPDEPTWQVYRKEGSARRTKWSMYRDQLILAVDKNRILFSRKAWHELKSPSHVEIVFDGCFMGLRSCDEYNIDGYKVLGYQKSPNTNVLYITAKTFIKSLNITFDSIPGKRIKLWDASCQNGVLSTNTNNFPTSV